jgi:hypothetical protein
MEPMLIGAAAGAALNRKNPIQGAMLGGFVGGAGGAMFPSISSALSTSAPASGILPSAASGSTTIAGSSLPTGAVQAFTTGPSAAMQAANLTTGPSGIIGTEAAKTGLFAGSPVTKPFISSGTSTGLIPSSMYEPTFMDRVGSIGQYAQNNPTLTKMALQSSQELLSQPQQQPAPAGIMRGSPSQVQMPQYQVGVPKVSLI